MTGARLVAGWSAAGLVAASVLPWHAVALGGTDSAFVLAVAGRWNLIPALGALGVILASSLRGQNARSDRATAIVAVLGLACVFAQAFLPGSRAQPGIRAGGVVVALSMLFCLTTALGSP